jgi:hypothetical protein
VQLPIENFEEFVLGLDRVEAIFGCPADVQHFLRCVCAAVKDAVRSSEVSRSIELTVSPQPVALEDLDAGYGPHHDAMRALAQALHYGLTSRGYPLERLELYFNRSTGKLVVDGRVASI